MPSALFIIAKEGFRDEELFEPKEILEAEGIQTTVASTEAGTATGKLGGTTEVELAARDANMKDYDILVLVGGPGAPALADYPEILELARKAEKLAAICIAPYILAKAGVISGKKATSYPAEPAISEFEKQGVIRVNEPVVQDGNLITADGPSSAKAFGEHIVNLLT